MDDMNQPPGTTQTTPQTPPDSVQGGYLQPAFWAGLCSGVLTGVPGLSIGCCLWMSGGGTLSVYFYKLMNGFPLRRPAEGARLGMLTGMFAFLFWAAVSFLSNVLISRGLANYVNNYRNQFEEAVSGSPQAKELIGMIRTTDGIIAMFVFMALAFLVAHILLAMLGGATAVRTFNQEKR
jgi:hypothetical protein